ncbi:MAG: hypothetical protein AB2693_19670 [Candidatus Thiodiazotropha sp.]
MPEIIPTTPQPTRSELPQKPPPSKMARLKSPPKPSEETAQPPPVTAETAKPKKKKKTQKLLSATAPPAPTAPPAEPIRVPPPTPGKPASRPGVAAELLGRYRDELLQKYDIRKSWCPDPYGVVVELQRKARPGEKIALDLPAYLVSCRGERTPGAVDDEEMGATSYLYKGPLSKSHCQPEWEALHNQAHDFMKVQDANKTFRTHGRDKGYEIEWIAWSGLLKVWPVNLVPDAKRDRLVRTNPLLQY